MTIKCCNECKSECPSKMDLMEHMRCLNANFWNGKLEDSDVKKPSVEDRGLPELAEEAIYTDIVVNSCRKLKLEYKAFVAKMAGAKPSTRKTRLVERAGLRKEQRRSTSASWVSAYEKHRSGVSKKILNGKRLNRIYIKSSITSEQTSGGPLHCLNI